MTAAPFAFVGPDPVRAPVERADAMRTDEAALRSAWRDARVLAIDANGDARSASDGSPLLAHGDAGAFDAARAVFLGLGADGHAWFAFDACDATGAPSVDLRAAAVQWDTEAACAFSSARAVLHWRRRHRFCGACGAPLAYARGGWLGQCAACGLEHYPRTDAAVIVAVGEGDRVLLGRQARWPARRYSVVAGFVEPGETLEQTVAREVLEETHVRVAACRYVASQPWPFPGALMLGFMAEAEPGQVPRASEELVDARWFLRDEVQAALAAERAGAPDDGPFLLPSPMSIAHWLIREWLGRAVAA